MATMAEYRSFCLKNGDLLTIRSASHKDASAIFNIYDRAYQDGIYMLKNQAEADLSVNKIINFIDNIEKSGFGFYVACVNEIIAGFIECYPLKFHRFRHILQLTLLVDYRCRRIDIGQKLIKYSLCQIEKYSEIEKISVSVHRSNKSAIALYELCGFKIEGIRIRDVKFEDGTYTDTVIMAKFLGPAS